jgi:hypothetical protein
MPRPQNPVSQQQLAANRANAAFAVVRLEDAARSRSSKGSKPCGTNYQAKPFSTPNPNKRKPLAPYENEPISPGSPCCAVSERCFRINALVRHYAQGHANAAARGRTLVGGGLRLIGYE